MCSDVPSGDEGTVVVHAYSSPGSLCLGSRAYRESGDAEAYSPGFGDGSVLDNGLMSNGYLTIWYGWAGGYHPDPRSELGKVVTTASTVEYTMIGTLNPDTSAQAYHLFDFVWDGNNLKSYRDGTLELSGTDTTYSSQDYVHLSSWGNHGSTIWDTDWIFIRKYADPEPRVTIDSEEEEPSQPIPEFSTMAIPVVSILGLLFLFNYRKQRKN